MALQVPQPQPFTGKDGSLLMDALNFLNELVRRVLGTAFQWGTASVSGQTAAIATTAISTQSLSAGLYRVSYSLRISQAAGTSSSATLTLSWTNGASVSCSQSFAAVTGNTTSTQQNGVVVIDIAAASSVSYAVAYASVGVPSMSYALDVRLEQLP